MRFCSVFFIGILASVSVFAASDPFVGKWAWNQAKSPKPKITYAVKDLGGNRYALTGSTGQTTTIKADGVPIDSPLGGTVSFRKLDNRNWLMVRKTSAEVDRTYTVSADDKTLKLTEVTKLADGGQDEAMVTYTRIGSGHGVFGEWQSVSMDIKSADLDMVVEPFDKDGLNFISPSDKSHSAMNFDGKQYAEQGPGGPTGTATSGKRLNPRLLQIEFYLKGQLDQRTEYRISEDGTTLTIVSRAVKSPAVFTNVYDRR